MTTIDTVGNIPTIQNGNAVNNQPKVSFRASIPTDNEVDAFISEQEKAKKKAKNQQNLNTAIQVAILGIFSLLAGLQMKSMGFFKKDFKINFKDLSKELNIDQMALPENLKKTMEKITNRIENYDSIIKRGGKKGSAILFYGPPGTGKNTFAYAITKKFPNAKFVEMDISKMNSKWHGESEQNVLGTMEAVIKEAKKNPKQKYFVFIDEIDSVMMKDSSSGAKLSNDVLNAFKKGFNNLTNEENIIVMGATNLKINSKLAALEGKQLDSAMLDRFAQKVLVDRPDKTQIKSAIEKYYANTERTMISSEIKDINNPKWEKIIDLLAKPERETSFRKLNSVLGEAAEIPKEGELQFKDIIQAIVDSKNSLNISDAELQAFLNSVK